MNEKLKEKTREALTSVLPITVIVLMLSVTLVPMEVGTLALFLTGAVLLIVGMGFFQLGAEISMTPLGQGIGGSIVRQKKTWLAVVICFAMGAIITISEPDLQVLANQVAAIPNAVLIWTVAAGVAGAFMQPEGRGNAIHGKRKCSPQNRSRASSSPSRSINSFFHHGSPTTMTVGGTDDTGGVGGRGRAVASPSRTMRSGSADAPPARGTAAP